MRDRMRKTHQQGQAHRDSREDMRMVTEMERQLRLFSKSTFSFFPVVEDQPYATVF